MSANITYNNKTGLLSPADEFNLYQISVKNGLNMTWSQWRANTGSVLVLTPLDLSIDEESIGSKGPYAFQALLTLQRPLSALFSQNEPAGGAPYELNVIPCYDEILYSGLDGQLVRGDANITVSKILAAPIEHGSWHNYHSLGLYGSGFWTH